MTAAAPLSGRDVEVRLSLLYASVFFVFGVQAPFIAVWLGSRGLDLGQIGVVLSAPRLLQFIALPVMARWADKRGGIVRMVAASAVLMASFFAFLIFASGLGATLVAVGLLFCAQSAIMPLIDVLTFAIFRPSEGPSDAALGANGRPGRAFDYGRLRKWGSAAFIAGNLAAGAFLTATSLTAITLALTAAATIAAAVAFYALPLDRLAHPAATTRAAQASGSRFGPLLLVIGAATLIQSSHVLVLTFGSVHWAQAGRSHAFIGGAWAIGVGAETLFFALVGRWVAGPERAAALMTLGGAVALARWLVMAFDPPAVVLALAQAGHGFSFAATHVGTVFLIAKGAPAHMRSRAQGWMTASIAGLSAIVTALGGRLYGGLGESAYFVMAALAGAGLGLALWIDAREARR